MKLIIKKYSIALLAIVVICIFSACSKTSNEQDDTAEANDRLQLKYAKGFDINYFDNYKSLIIYNPWVEGEVQQRYYLVENDTISVPTNGTKIVVPLTTVAVSSCTHFEFISLLDEIEKITAICAPELVYNETILERYNSGKIINLGDNFNVNAEKLMLLQPSGFMMSSYNQVDDNSERLIKSGVKVLYNNEWTENSLLARAEWIKYMAVLFDKEEEANEIFNEIEESYIAATKLVENIEKRPTVMAGGNFKGTWYMPSGASYMGKLFADAGGDYLYANDSTTGSLALNFETVLNNFNNADVWLNAPVSDLKSLIQMDERHNLFESAKSGDVYAFNARTNKSTNDFWESGIAHPDLVLKDVIWALHPDVLEDYTPTYILKLK